MNSPDRLPSKPPTRLADYGVGGRDAGLAAKSDAVCRMGALMLAAGSGSYRVKVAMGRVAHALGIDELDAQVSLNEIVVTTRWGKRFRTQVTEVPVPVVNADRIRALLRLSLRADNRLTVESLQRKLDRVERRPHLYPPALVVLGAALACAAFAFLNNGLWQECLAAAIGAGLGKLAQLRLRRYRLNQLAIVALASFVACLSYMGVSFGLQAALPGMAPPVHAMAFTSAVLFLVPGFPLITAALDLARFDFVSGMSRLLYASLITLAAAVGAWSVALMLGLAPGELDQVARPWGVLLALRALASFVGVLGFAMTFNTPMKVSLAASAIGTVANVGRLAAVDAGLNPLACALVATVAVGLLAAWASRRVLAPRIILSVPAVLVMVPGTSTYRALLGFINRDMVTAITNGMTSMVTVVALAGGLVVARMFTDPGWVSSSPDWTNMKRTGLQKAMERREADAAASAQSNT